ncbi:unnamed protein product [Linum trigynum]|uniref:Uncharacterized protein n=1 Tax=Linum trigynum TaxID=586398 RepID=A0AAV2EVK4_9ROSI
MALKTSNPRPGFPVAASVIVAGTFFVVIAQAALAAVVSHVNCRQNSLKSCSAASIANYDEFRKAMIPICCRYRELKEDQGKKGVEIGEERTYKESRV